MSEQFQLTKPTENYLFLSCRQLCLLCTRACAFYLQHLFSIYTTGSESNKQKNAISRGRVSP